MEMVRSNRCLAAIVFKNNNGSTAVYNVPCDEAAKVINFASGTTWVLDSITIKMDDFVKEVVVS